jgi:DNA repair exonuclease SbcCD ATPase subunit
MSQDPGRPLSKLLRETTELMGKEVAARAHLNRVESELALAKQRQALETQTHQVALKHFRDAERRHNDALTKVTAAEKEFHREADYLDLMRGFRNKIFDEVLEGISAESSNVVAALPNAQHISIDFKSERVTGSGTIEQRIKPTVTIYGEERSLVASVSGGQFTSVELAVDLAVARVVSARLGCNLQWMILDESFEGHDPATKEACMTLLQQYAADKLIIIVDHSSEFKEMFTQEILVEQHDRLSKVGT